MRELFGGDDPGAAEMSASCDGSPLVTFGDLLRHPEPPLVLVEAAKRFARKNANKDSSALPTEIATVLYFATIAAALLHHGERITRSGDDVLRYGFQLTLERPWLDETTRSLVTEALEQFAGPAEKED